MTASALNPGMAARARRTAGPVRVLIADDSAVMRRLLTRMLSSDPGIEVVGTATNGRETLAAVERSSPDLVTLDVEMPEMDGLEALRLIQARFPACRVIMCSSLTRRGAAVTIDALLAGASDYVSKQHSAGLTEDAYEDLRRELLRKIRHIFEPPAAFSRVSPAVPPGAPEVKAARPAAPLAAYPWLRSPQVLVVGISTGGPSALAEILPLLPRDFPLPVAIVQHMPPLFTQLLAERLSRLSSIPVVEGAAGMAFEPGHAYVAPGDFHMRLVRKAARVEIELNRDSPENSCRPAVDVLFRSAAEVYGGRAIALVMTGMGQDGLEGVRPLKARGAAVLVQDSATSVVWGMPGAVATAGLADAVLPLVELIPEVMRRL